MCNEVSAAGWQLSSRLYMLRYGVYSLATRQVILTLVSRHIIIIIIIIITSWA